MYFPPLARKSPYKTSPPGGWNAFESNQQFKQVQPTLGQVGTEFPFDVATQNLAICCHIDFSSLLCRDGVRGWNWSPLHGLSARPGVGGWWGNSQSCGYYVFLTTIIIILSGDTGYTKRENTLYTYNLLSTRHCWRNPLTFESVFIINLDTWRPSLGE